MKKRFPRIAYYYKKGWTMSRLAKHYKVARQTIRRYLVKEGLYVPYWYSSTSPAMEKMKAHIRANYKYADLLIDEDIEINAGKNYIDYLREAATPKKRAYNKVNGNS
jgi:DNA-binding transcriptional regulator LsrR (DeoR family)